MYLIKYRSFITVIFALLLVTFSSCPSAHQMSTGYLNLDATMLKTQTLSGQLQLRWFDLDRKIKIDLDQDGELKWHEVTSQQLAIGEYILQHLSLHTQNETQQNQPCNIVLDNNMKTDNHFDEGYLVYGFTATCSNTSADTALTIEYTGIFDIDPDHKLIVSVQGLSAEASSISGLIDSNQQEVTFTPEQNSIFTTFSTFVYQGVVHILIGTDHILFIIVLLLTCTLYREDRKWQAKQSFLDVVKSATWVITAFTLAHSITLTATALGWVAPSSRWVEFGIALSVLVTALNNIWPLVVRLGWITFAFGLLHGMGFASVLAELGLAQEHKLLSILSFNLGVELGQLAILAAVIPVLFALRKQQWYQAYGVNIGSFVIAIVAASWCIERI